MGVSNNTAYTECQLFVDGEWLVKETEKAWCFKLWKKRFFCFPKKIIKGFTFNGTLYIITMPKWFVEENEIKYLMDKEVRKLLFPTKAEKKAQESSLFSEVVPKLESSIDKERAIYRSELPDWMK